MEMNLDRHSTAALAIGVMAFLASWVYCIFEYGFLLGVGAGWLPSAIVSILMWIACHWLFAARRLFR